MSIRLVVSDMDGTLFLKDEVVPPIAAAFVKELENKGILFSVATGRSRYMAQRFVDFLGIKAPYVVANGAMIAQQGGIVSSMVFDASGLRPLVEYARANGMTVVFSGEEGPDSFLEPTPWLEKQQGLFHLDYRPFVDTDETWKKLPLQKLFIKDDSRRIWRICDQLDQLSGYQYIRYEDGCVEVVPPGVNKAFGVSRLAELVGVDPSEVLAIGDFVNDIEMITWAGVGAAVGNASQEIKSLADYVCREPIAYGVWEAIRQVCR